MAKEGSSTSLNADDSVKERDFPKDTERVGQLLGSLKSEKETTAQEKCDFKKPRNGSENYFSSIDKNAKLFEFLILIMSQRVDDS